MIIIPAIDIINGECVRLVKGDYNTAHKVAESPYKTVQRFIDAGAKRIHIVDLDGAKEKKPINFELIKDLVKAFDVDFEVGGGIRTEENIKDYYDIGVKGIILGSVALTDKNLVIKSVEKYEDKICVGIDAKDGFVSANGWLETSNIHFCDLAKSMYEIGVKNFIFTDISKDGTLEGPNLCQLKEISEAVPNGFITASGGIKDINDIINLNKMNLYGAICGKSIYSGTLDLKKAIEVVK